MLKVKNNKAIASLSNKSLKANRTRNSIAMAAIVLTTILFTALFTITSTMINSFQMATFRMVGGDMHGTFKYLTEEELEQLSGDPLIVKTAVRKMVGMPMQSPFHKSHVEISYMDENCAIGYFCTPTTGTLPQEGTNQIACDTRILKLLGVEPKLGAEIKLNYGVGINEKISREDTFTLCGWWEYDEVCAASQAIVAESFANQVLDEYEGQLTNEASGKWDLNVYFASSAHIQADMDEILAHYGYQSQNQQEKNYIATGVNHAYLGAHMSQSMDGGTICAITALILLIMLTGYLIIYNIFQISVENDIRFYGLLKTIGTTGRQIKRMILRQALILSGIGIPIGLILGYLAGNQLAPVIMANMTYKNVAVTTDPTILIIATAFSLITVLISCYKPGKIAGKVSPIEAVRYTQNEGKGKKRERKNNSTQTKSLPMFLMALANLGRNRKKTLLVILSLTLAVVLLQATCIFTNGFDMDKFIKSRVVSDYQVAHASYFQTGANWSSQENRLPEEVITTLGEQVEITEAGRIYGTTQGVQEYMPKEAYAQYLRRFGESEETIEAVIDRQEKTDDGKIVWNAQLYGMEKFPLDKLRVIDGDLSQLYNSDSKAIVAVYDMDDYGNAELDSNWAKVGDQITLNYIDEWEAYDTRTNNKVENAESIDEEYLDFRAARSHEEIYTVVACVTMQSAMSYRYWTAYEFVLNADTFIQDTGSKNVMSYIYNTSETTNTRMEAFLKDYTENIEPTLSYESKNTYVDSFIETKNMFLLLGGVLCAIIGMVGILNFFNAIMTSIMTRKREFAMLQSIGMTGKQLKRMLVYEGLLYAAFTLVLSIVLSIAMIPVMENIVGSIIWFFTYRLTFLPILLVTPLFLLIGVLLPIILYRINAKHTIVEQMHEIE